MQTKTKMWTLSGFLLCVFILCPFLLISCDILSAGSDEDLLQKIDDEIAWANAKKITVTVAYPIEWGTSNQSGIGRCGDTRVGYAFNVDFTPEYEYALLGWRAYRTADLTDDWLENPARYFDVLKKVKQIENVILPQISESGGLGTVTINTPENITLIPFSRAQPRIVSSTPDNTTRYYSRVRPISITFAAPIKNSTIEEFSLNKVSIIARKINENGQTVDPIIRLDGWNNPADQCYDTPQLVDGKTLVINPIINSSSNIFGAPENSEITLTLGREIETALGNSLENPVSITWRTRKTDVFVDSWNAECEDDQIYVSWNLSEETAPVIKYTVGGVDTEDDTLSSTASQWFLDVNVYNPKQISATLKQYEIYIGYNSDGQTIYMDDPILIWNIPGMKVSSEKPAIIIINDTQLMSMSLDDPDQSYILDRDITISYNGWKPIGEGVNENAFKSRFFGMGYKITFSSFVQEFDRVQFQGLFGYVDGAVIQDLTVEYSANVTTSYNGTYAYIGGIAGSAAGSTIISNCTVEGASPGVTLQNATSAGIVLGGMVGRMEGQTIIKDSTASLNVEVIKETAGNINIGAVTALNTSVPADSAPSLSGLTVTGNVTVTRTAAGSDPVYAGGVNASQGRGGRLEDISYAGTVTINNTGGAGYIYVGGIVGVLNNDSSAFTLENCRLTSAASIQIPNSTSGLLFAGGIAGGPYTTDDNTFGGFCSMSNCTAEGGLNITSAGLLRVGGIAGHLRGNGPGQIASIENCTYKTGSITVSGSTGLNYIGGIAGYAHVDLSFDNCQSQALLIEANKTGDTNTFLYAGGFCGEFQNTNITVKNCSSTSPMKTTSVSRNHTAGFVGGNYYANLENCSVTIASPGKIEATINSPPGITADMYAGGLAGWNNSGTITGCYAEAEVKAENSSGALRAGGLVGYTNGSISKSWTGGTVSAARIADNTGNIDAGGIAGTINNATIIDCYALGDVTVVYDHSQALHLAAGGIVGTLGNSSVHTSFSAGRVEIKSGTTFAARAGGIIGTNEITGGSHAVNKSVVLGESVTASAGIIGSNVLSAYRIGYKGNISFIDNFAIDTMKIGTSTGGYGAAFTPIEADQDIGPTEENGENVSGGTGTGELGNAGFWKGTMQFDPAIWDTSVVGAARKCPKLIGVGGQ